MDASTPQMCGYYSITSDREYDATASSLRYFKKPSKFPLDLNTGIESIIAKPDSYFDEKMDSILTYIVRNRAQLMNADQNTENALIPSTKYITYRGVIKKIMCSPYEKRSGWCALVTKYKNNIYMSQLTKPENRNVFPNEWCKKLCYYGPKFQQYCLTDDPNAIPDPSKVCDDRTQFFGVFKRMLVGRNFLFSGEMDGIASDQPVNLNELETLNDLKFIELKVTADPSSSKYSPRNFITKCQIAWAQSFLTGVEDIYFGMRDKNGIVSKIQHYATDDLIGNDSHNIWDPSKCFKFLDNFLKLVEVKTEEIDCPHTVFEFNFNEQTQNITCTKHPGKTDLSLLPDFYLDAFEI